MAYQVFISFKRNALDGSGKTRDYELAADLYRTLTAEGIKTFFSEENLFGSSFAQEIYKTLDEVNILIVVGTRPEHMESEWVRNEWTTFESAMLNGRKPNGQILTYLEGVPINRIPLALGKYQSFYASDKKGLLLYVKQILGIKASAPQKSKKTAAKSVKSPASGAKTAAAKQTASVAAAKPQSKLPQQNKPAARPKPAPKPTSAPRRQVTVGDILSFGSYPQGANGEVMPLQWRVLDVQGGRALLITDKLIDCVKYHSVRTNVTWGECTLRKWLNEEFMGKAFDRSQRAQMASVTIVNPDNAEYGTPGGGATQDRLFVLSVEEVKRYFREDDRMAAVTPYVTQQNGYTSNTYSLPHGGSTGWWWLRSPGNSGCNAVHVHSDGQIIRVGRYVNTGGGSVRPAFWLKLES